MHAPSGEQLCVAFGDQEAVVTEVGAGLRQYAAGGQDVVAGFGEGEIAPAGRGQVLAPWPNRLEDGSYEFGGVAGRAPLDEPERRNAIHGLVRWLRWHVAERSEAAVELACDLAPQPAYPFSLRLTVAYRLGADGLTVTSTATCTGERELPFGLGFHPYLTVGTETVDTATLRLPARRRLLLDERGLPAGEQQVAGTDADFSASRPLGPLHLDDCFTGFDGDGAGDGTLAEAVLADPASGREVCLWVGTGFPYLMCYTGDTLPDPADRRRAIAIEPMSCPPNALRSGDALVRLAPGGRWAGQWGIRPGAA